MPKKHKYVSPAEYYFAIKRNRELEAQVVQLQRENTELVGRSLDKPEPPAQPGVTQGENFGTGIIESSMKQVQRRVCHQNGHQIALAMDELVSKRATYADAPAKEIARERTWMCLRCGMSLAEIRGEK